MKQTDAGNSRSRILCCIEAKGCCIREENGKLVSVSGLWIAPLVSYMSRSMCHWVLLGIAGRKDHSVILSRRQVDALQRFQEKALSVNGSSHDQDELREVQ